jgi:N,N-dimethylformamidase
MSRLIGYVSDESFVAIPDVPVEITGQGRHVDTRSTASGAVLAGLPDGVYRVTLNKPGFGGKRSEVRLPVDAPVQFRLLRDRLLGYIWPKWLRCGERGEFRVHSAAAYKLELWRYGWNKEKIRTIGWYDEHGPRATVQVTPDGDYTQQGVRWNEVGYWSPHHRQFLEAPQRPGLYYLHAANEAGEFFSFPWIVSPPQATAAVAVLLGWTTWNAYNNFGGRSNYIHPIALPAEPTVNARMELERYTQSGHVQYSARDYAPLSFERPEPINHVPLATQATDPIEGRAACHVAPAEWRLLAWLEREALAHDVYSDVQLHFNRIPLDDYRTVILPAHPEYYSAEMYHRLKTWVQQRGGKLMYLGGNGLNCDVEFLDETRCIYRNEDNRRLEDKRWESRFHLRHESEAQLLGVVYDDRGIMTAAPYETIEAGHWVFRGTGLATGQPFGHRSQHERVPGGASGHETDKISASSPTNVVRLARGLNPDNGGADMVVYETNSGGAVFSSGSINWITSLLVDEHVSQITANVVRRFAGWEQANDAD